MDTIGSKTTGVNGIQQDRINVMDRCPAEMIIAEESFSLTMNTNKRGSPRSPPTVRGKVSLFLQGGVITVKSGVTKSINRAACFHHNTVTEAVKFKPRNPGKT